MGLFLQEITTKIWRINKIFVILHDESNHIKILIWKEVRF